MNTVSTGEFQFLTAAWYSEKLQSDALVLSSPTSDKSLCLETSYPPLSRKTGVAKSRGACTWFFATSKRLIRKGPSMNCLVASKIDPISFTRLENEVTRIGVRTLTPFGKTRFRFWQRVSIRESSDHDTTYTSRKASECPPRSCKSFRYE